MNPHSNASGLFQFLPGTWDRWNPETPDWKGESVFHPEANVATAAKLVDVSVKETRGRWGQWSCCETVLYRGAPECEARPQG
jgi:hypothetical protein